MNSDKKKLTHRERSRFSVSTTLFNAAPKNKMDVDISNSGATSRQTFLTSVCTLSPRVSHVCHVALWGRRRLHLLRHLHRVSPDAELWEMVPPVAVIVAITSLTVEENSNLWTLSVTLSWDERLGNTATDWVTRSYMCRCGKHTLVCLLPPLDVCRL